MPCSNHETGNKCENQPVPKVLLHRDGRLASRLSEPWQRGRNVLDNTTKNFEKPTIANNRGFFIWTNSRHPMNSKSETNNDNNRRVPIQFASDVQFDATPATAPARAELRELFARLQDRLIQQCLYETRNSVLRRNLHRAADEAAAVAWTTPYPLLVMPTLFEEKTLAARLRTVRQNQIRERSERLAEDLS